MESFLWLLELGDCVGLLAWDGSIWCQPFQHNYEQPLLPLSEVSQFGDYMVAPGRTRRLSVMFPPLIGH